VHVEQIYFSKMYSKNSVYITLIISYYSISQALSIFYLYFHHATFPKEILFLSSGKVQPKLNWPLENGRLSQWIT
jgi:hypothetical protein